MGSTVETQQWYSEAKWYSWTGDWASWRAGEGITEVPSDIPAQTYAIHLRWNQIEVIGENSFSNLRMCFVLDLRQNRIHTIEDGALDDLVSLKRLQLDDNAIEELRQDVFVGLINCMYLTLDTNNIHTIHRGALDGLQSLTELILTRNKLTILRSHTFTRLTKLRRLWLQINEIKTIEPECFFSNVSMELTLKLHFNPILNFPWTAFGKEHPLKLDLTLSNGSYPHVCNNFFCWIKQGEQEGWITWQQDIDIFWGSSYTGVFQPRCEGMSWEDTNLPCSHLGMKV